MPASNVSSEISHLVRDKKYPHKRAVAAALDMKRRGRFNKRKPSRPSKRRSYGRR